MKSNLPVLAVVLVGLRLLACGASGQELPLVTPPVMHLSTGQSFSYQFQTLPLGNPLHLGVPGNYGYFGLYLPSGGDLLTTGESLRMDWFENSLLDAPTASVTRYGTNFPFTMTIISQPNMWQDLQGAVRVTVLNGGIDLADIEISVVRNTDVYDQIVPVPEPSTLRLSAVGLLAVAYVWRARRRLGCR